MEKWPIFHSYANFPQGNFMQLWLFQIIIIKWSWFALFCCWSAPLISFVLISWYINNYHIVYYCWYIKHCYQTFDISTTTWSYCWWFVLHCSKHVKRVCSILPRSFGLWTCIASLWMVAKSCITKRMVELLQPYK